MNVAETEIGRRAALMLVAIVGALLFSSGMALAATVTCQANVECFGTRKADTIQGTDGPDRMFGSGGGDTMNGFGSGEIMYGQRGRDTLGGSEVDYLIGAPATTSCREAEAPSCTFSVRAGAKTP